MVAAGITKADIQAASSPDGIRDLFAKLGYNVSEPLDQTAAALGVAEKVHHQILAVQQIAAVKTGGLNTVIYRVESTKLTAELRKAMVSAFRNKPVNALLVIATREYDPIEFVLVE